MSRGRVLEGWRSDGEKRVVREGQEWWREVQKEWQEG